ncbi:hypothetical protein CARUB_v10013069mg [Capsella rubella]|uniref:Uncharacterized protein n=1 Tax=Capsella rubella TaxID=81985 RepID=R0HVU9_9BRAS|nr:pre-rRNA-processing protein ESF1 [Capsella rubella]EOA29500.1 hypothetical protein CARUB_v10013069mg [Capsella rubella]
MGSKNKKQRKGESNEAKGSGGGVAEEGKHMINDPRFSSAHTDPRFRRMPRRELKVAIDSRFKPVLSDKRFALGSAPVDKRGKRRRGGTGDNLLRDFYRIDDEDDKKKKKKKDTGEDESGDESEKELVDLKSEAESEEESEPEKKLASLDDESNEEAESDEEAESEEVSEEEEEEEDTDEDDEAIYEDDEPEIPEENIPTIPQETHRLALVNMDWKYVSAKDLYVVLNSFLPKDGRILSVAVYPSEFGLQRMKEEEIHGPVIDGDKKNGDGDDDEEDEEEEDEDVNNQKLRAYEISRLKYYFAVAECDSSATADYLYKSCDGIEFERSSNKLDLRFIPDSMEFKHPPRDIASEAPAGYEGLDFQSRALQLSKVSLTWDEDEPHRIKTLNQKFNPEQLADLEMKEFLASDESESDDEDDNNEGINRNKVEKRKDKYRALIESENVDSDKDVEEENDQDMEVTFNTGLEDLSKEILKKKDKKSESVWESYLRQRREKKRARKNNKQNDDSSSPDDDDDDYIDRKAVKGDGDDDFFMAEPPLKKKKEGKTKKKGLEEEVAADERARAELELLLADENAGDGNGLKGYNIKRKGKKGKTDISEEKIPAGVLDPRFSAAYSPAYAIDPTDPQFKRSATYIRQLAMKQKEVSKSHEEAEETAPKEKQELNSDGNLGSKKERHELSSTVKSLKMKMINKDSEKKQAGNAVTSSTLAQRIKKKAKDLSKK